jgi:cellulose synthase (UDP-forming)
MYISLDAIRDAFWPGLCAGGLLMAILPFLRQNHHPTRLGLVLFALITLLQYIVWRFAATLPPFGATLDWIVGFCFATVEAATLMGVAISLFAMSRTRDRTPEVEAHLPQLLSRSALPLVDVLICTYNEEESILERTITGALNLDYPNFRVWVLDDGRRPPVQELAHRLGARYMTRSDNAHAKAGNINNALRHLAQLVDPPEFIAVLDADFVPLPVFLKRTMALFHDERVGVVQTPQHFANADPIQINLSATQVWPDEQRYFFDVLMPARDAWHAAFCCGTSSLIRMRALTEIGGFPTDSITEDYLLSLRLKERGILTAYLNEALSFGLAPEGLKEYLTQRSRWCLGFMQICRGPSGPFSRRAPIRLLDRAFLLESFMHWTAAHAFRLLGILIPIAYLLFGIVAVDVALGDFLAHYLPFFIVQSMVLSWLTEQRVIPIMSDVAQLIAAPAALRAALAGLLHPKGQKFQVTAKGGERGQRFVEWPLLRTFLSLLGLTVLGILASFMTGLGPNHPNASVLALFWSWYNIVVLIVACYVCIEQPRKRKSDRFEGLEQAVVQAEGGASLCPLIDISVTGAALAGPSPGEIGKSVTFRLPTLNVRATIIRAGNGFFAVRFGDSLSDRVALIRYIYSGRCSHALKKIHWGDVFRAVSSRLFG